MISHTPQPAPENTRSTAPVPPTTAPARPSGDRHIRAATVTVVVILAVVAFYVSYRHQYDLALGYGEPADTARLFPITIDGIIITASLIMLYCARWEKPVPRLARLALWLGIGATLAANVAHGWPAGWGGRLVSAAPAAALVIAYELLMWLIRTMRVETPQPVAERVVYRDRTIEIPVEVEIRQVPADRFEAARWAVDDALAAGRRPPGRRALADRFGLETREAVEILDQAAQDHDRQARPEPGPDGGPVPVAAVNGTPGASRTEEVA
ncbi:DUF2637 domain-containing protein [Thermoactinospora rubra]|uniref:DUF2637 domain-containing protein n=1 Tax=Thermoactinospora rubra TaxID=1088767 RepID=UPI000A113E8B|nr:DUF2637 domain-containing protein [Thermoactinospora rubra]